MSAQAGIFHSKWIIGLVAFCTLAFVFYLFLSSYTTQWGEGNDGRAHALSSSAIGYHGWVEMEKNMGVHTQLVRSPKDLNDPGLLVIMPDKGDAEHVAGIVNARNALEFPTLIILPKHYPIPHGSHPGWMGEDALIDTNVIGRILSKLGDFKVEQVQTDVQDKWADLGAPVPLFTNQKDVQVISGGHGTDDVELTPMITDAQQHILLGRLGRGVFILTDPDLVNNLGMANPWRAYEAHRILTSIAVTKSNDGQPYVHFDLTLNGFAQGRTLIDLMLHPPFLGMSLALMVAGVLALLGGLLRFGPALHEVRAIPHGKNALVANTGEMLKQSKDAYSLGAPYADLVRDWAASRLGLSWLNSHAQTDARLDALSSKNGARKFSDLAYIASNAGHNDEMIAATQALDKWKKDHLT